MKLYILIKGMDNYSFTVSAFCFVLVFGFVERKIDTA